jgi:hypothetical protein
MRCSPEDVIKPGLFTDGNESNAKLVPIIDGLHELHQSGCKENRVLAVCQMLPDHAPMEVKN